jgi:hypothetical protein
MEIRVDFNVGFNINNKFNALKINDSDLYESFFINYLTKKLC